MVLIVYKAYVLDNQLTPKLHLKVCNQDKQIAKYGRYIFPNYIKL